MRMGISVKVEGTSIWVSELQINRQGRSGSVDTIRLFVDVTLVPLRHIKIVRNTLRRSLCKYFVCLYTTSGCIPLSLERRSNSQPPHPVICIHGALRDGSHRTDAGLYAVMMLTHLCRTRDNDTREFRRTTISIVTERYLMLTRSTLHIENATYALQSLTFIIPADGRHFPRHFKLQC
jgi:hypothetical protein